MTADIQIKDRVDTVEWDKFCRENGGNVFQSPYFFEMCRAAAGYHPHVLFAVDDERIVSSLLAVEVRFLPAILNPFANRIILYGGILWEDSERGINAAQVLMQHFITFKNLPSFLFIEFRNFSDAAPIRPGLEVLGIQYYDYLNYTVNLRPPLDEILKAVRREKRKKIRAGERNGLKLQEAKSIEEVALFYQILKKTYQQKKVPLADSSLFTEKFTAYNAEKVYRILLVEYGGQVIGGQALLFYNGIAYAWYMAVDDAYFHLRVSDWLVWKTIEYVRSSGCSLFDFCGAGRPDEKYGVRDFKKSFGGEEVNYGRFIFTPRPRLYGFMNSLYSLGSKK